MSKIKVRWFKQENAHSQTDGHTHTHTDATKRIISPATQSIKIEYIVFEIHHIRLLTVYLYSMTNDVLISLAVWPTVSKR